LKPTSATVTITRDRDAVAIATGASCTVTTDRVEYALAAQSTVSNLTAVFTVVAAAGTSTVSVPVQVAGARSTSVNALRRLKPLDNVNRYPDWLLEQTITEVEDQLEAACGVSFVPVERTFRVNGSGTSELFTRYGRPRSISSITVSNGLNSQTLDATTISNLTLDEESGVILNPYYSWTCGRRNILVTGVFGYAQTPPSVSQAVAEGVRQALVDSRVDSRATSVTNEDGTTAVLVTAGVRGALFSLPQLNQVVQMYGQSFGVA
jgi:hypothetical protein